MTLVPLSFWYMKHSIGNTFKRHKIMFIFLVLFVVGLIVLSNIANEKEKQKAQEAAESGITEEKKYDVIPEYATLDKLYDTEDGQFIGDANGKVHEMGPIIIEGVVFMIVILVVGISFATGAKSGANFFSMADVNFLFPSPHKPQSVLAFKMIAQVGMALLGSLFLLYQYPNLVGNGLFTPVAFIACFFAYVGLSIMNNVISLASYLLFYNHPKIRPMVSKIVLVIGALPILIFLFLAFVLKIGLYKSLTLVCTSIGTRLIPFIGWMKTCFTMLIREEYLLALAFFAVSVIFCVLLLKWIFSKEVDFYEDSLDFAMVQQQTLERMKDKKKGLTNTSLRSKESIEKKSNKIRNKMISFDRAPGAKAFFKKNLGNRMRQSRLKGLLAGSFLFNLLTSGILFYTYWKVLSQMKEETEGIPEQFYQVFVLVVALVFAFILYFRARTNPLQLDMNVNFIYMVPETMSSILLWSYAEYILEGLVDLLPVAVLLYLVSDLNIGLALLFFVLLLIYYVYTSLCGFALNCIFRVYIAKLMMQILSFILAGAPLFILYQLRGKMSLSKIYLFAGFTIWMLLALSIVFFIVCAKLLRRGKQ